MCNVRPLVWRVLGSGTRAPGGDRDGCNCRQNCTRRGAVARWRGSRARRRGRQGGGRNRRGEELGPRKKDPDAQGDRQDDPLLHHRKPSPSHAHERAEIPADMPARTSPRIFTVASTAQPVLSMLHPTAARSMRRGARAPGPKQWRPPPSPRRLRRRWRGSRAAPAGARNVKRVSYLVSNRTMMNVTWSLVSMKP